METWMMFVNGNRLLSKPSITIGEIDTAHSLLCQFVSNCVSNYGPDFISFNMHMGLHLKQTLQDFGPLYGTWLFAFERANKEIKGINTNSKQGLEVTYMEKFTQQVHAVNYINQLPTRIRGNSTMMEVLGSLVPTDNDVVNQHGSFDSSKFVDYFTNKEAILTGSEQLPPDAVLPEYVELKILHDMFEVLITGGIYCSNNGRTSSFLGSSAPKALYNEMYWISYLATSPDDAVPAFVFFETSERKTA